MANILLDTAIYSTEPTLKIFYGQHELLHHFMILHQDAFAWDDSEHSHFCEDFFPPVVILTIPHHPWVVKNCPIPPGLYKHVMELIQ
jgi:hypothetical protein